MCTFLLIRFVRSCHRSRVYTKNGMKNRQMKRDRENKIINALGYITEIWVDFGSRLALVMLFLLLLGCTLFIYVSGENALKATRMEQQQHNKFQQNTIFNE